MHIFYRLHQLSQSVHSFRLLKFGEKESINIDFPSVTKSAEINILSLGNIYSKTILTLNNYRENQFFVVMEYLNKIGTNPNDQGFGF